MSKFTRFIKQNRSLLIFIGLFATASVFAAAAPTTYDVRSAAGIPADAKTIVDNAITTILLLTGGGATLSAMKGSVGLVSGLIRSMFSA